jgi:hypothetical protein
VGGWGCWITAFEKHNRRSQVSLILYQFNPDHTSQAENKKVDPGSCASGPCKSFSFFLVFSLKKLGLFSYKLWLARVRVGVVYFIKIWRPSSWLESGLVTRQSMISETRLISFNFLLLTLINLEQWYYNLNFPETWS